jgi:hypothetical protein
VMSSLCSRVRELPPAADHWHLRWKTPFCVSVSVAVVSVTWLRLVLLNAVLSSALNALVQVEVKSL